MPMIEKILAISAIDKAQNQLGEVGKQTGLGAIKPGDAGLYSTLALLTNTVLGAVGIIASIYLIYAGIKWMKAGGDENEIKEAKLTIRSAVWGLLIVFGAYIIVNFVITRLISAVTT